MTKHLVEPYIVNKQDKLMLDKLKCDLFRRISLRNGYQKILDLFNLDDNPYDAHRMVWTDKVTGTDMIGKLKTWVEDLNGEIWMSIKGYRFPLMIEAK